MGFGSQIVNINISLKENIDIILIQDEIIKSSEILNDKNIILITCMPIKQRREAYWKKLMKPKKNI